MAVLGKIRERTFFLILIIGLALFAFVISGLFDKRPHQMPQSIAVVNGDEIPYDTFRSQVEATINQYGRNSQIGTMYVVNTLWKQAVQAKILDQQFNKLGITVGKDQIISIVSKSPEFAQNSAFLNANGIFDPNKFSQYIANLQQTNPSAFAHWQRQENQIADVAKYHIYLSLIRSALGATASEGELAYKQEVEKADIKYVMLPYSSIPDSDVKITDDEIQKYIKDHAKEYQREEGRNIQFVVVNEEATQEDRQEIQQKLKALEKPSVVYNKVTQSNDSLPGFAHLSLKDIAEFVNEHSDISYDSLYITKDKLPAVAIDALWNLSENQLYGPYEDNGYYKLSRVLGRVGNAQVRASHILISYKGAIGSQAEIVRTKEEAKKKAEQILAEVQKTGADFVKIANENTDDKSVVDGDLNFFSRGTMVKSFNDFAFSKKVGDIGIVETDFGYHIIKITDAKEGIRLATIARKIEPSSQTRDQAYVKATNFEVEVTNNPKIFVDIAQKESLSVIPALNLEVTSEHIIGLGTNRQVVHWAFNKDTKEGSIKRFDIKNGYVIVQLTKKIKKGLSEVSDVRVGVENVLRKQKKAKELIQKLKGSTLQEVAQNSGKPILEALNLSIKSQVLTGGSFEPNVVGVAFALDPSKISSPIEGDSGVYVIEVTKKEKATPLSNYASYMHSLRLLKEGRASADLFSSLEKESEIEDNRALFY